MYEKERMTDFKTEKNESYLLRDIYLLKRTNNNICIEKDDE